MKTRLLIITALALVPLIIPNVLAMCAAEALQWWEPCNDTGEFSDGIYVKYTILIPILIVVTLLSGITLLFYRRKRK
jgi:hypothetical protein